MSIKLIVISIFSYFSFSGLAEHTAFSPSSIVSSPVAARACETGLGAYLNFPFFQEQPEEDRCLMVTQVRDSAREIANELGIDPPDQVDDRALTFVGQYGLPPEVQSSQEPYFDGLWSNISPLIPESLSSPTKEQFKEVVLAKYQAETETEDSASPPEIPTPVLNGGRLDVMSTAGPSPQMTSPQSSGLSKKTVSIEMDVKNSSTSIGAGRTAPSSLNSSMGKSAGLVRQEIPRDSLSIPPIASATNSLTFSNLLPVLPSPSASGFRKLASAEAVVPSGSGPYQKSPAQMKIGSSEQTSEPNPNLEVSVSSKVDVIAEPKIQLPQALPDSAINENQTKPIGADNKTKKLSDSSSIIGIPSAINSAENTNNLYLLPSPAGSNGSAIRNEKKKIGKSKNIFSGLLDFAKKHRSRHQLSQRAVDGDQALRLAGLKDGRKEENSNRNISSLKHKTSLYLPWLAFLGGAGGGTLLLLLVLANHIRSRKLSSDVLLLPKKRMRRLN